MFNTSCRLCELFITKSVKNVLGEKMDRPVSSASCAPGYESGSCARERPRVSETSSGLARSISTFFRFPLASRARGVLNVIRFQSDGEW
jgi:hypothetical protein